MTNKLVQLVEQPHLKKDVPQFAVGDTVDVATRIIEGEKERIQVFSGVVIMKKGAGINETFTVRRIVNNEGVERIFPLHSPFLSRVTVKRSGQARRAKLFYLRRRVGKATRIKGRTVHEVAGSESQPIVEPQVGGEKAPEAKAPAKE